MFNEFYNNRIYYCFILKQSIHEYAKNEFEIRCPIGQVTQDNND